MPRAAGRRLGGGKAARYGALSQYYHGSVALVSVRLMSWAFHEAPTTRKGDLLVLLVLADHAHDDGGSAYPSVATIARLARMSERGVQTALRHLRDAGIVTAQGRTASGTTVYRLHVAPAAVAPPQPSHPPQPLRSCR